MNKKTLALIGGLGLLAYVIFKSVKNQQAVAASDATGSFLTKGLGYLFGNVDLPSTGRTSPIAGTPRRAGGGNTAGAGLDLTGTAKALFDGLKSLLGLGTLPPPTPIPGIPKPAGPLNDSPANLGFLGDSIIGPAGGLLNGPAPGFVGDSYFPTQEVLDRAANERSNWYDSPDFGPDPYGNPDDAGGFDGFGGSVDGFGNEAFV